jgi:AraC-like DNA-binding protein
LLHYPFLFTSLAAKLFICTKGITFQNEILYSKMTRVLAKSDISTFFIQLMRDHEEDILLDPDNASPHDDELILMLQYIQSNYANLSLTKLASFFGYSPRHITRILKENTGENFTEITKELRMKKAAELLKNSHQFIFPWGRQHIAVSVAFDIPILQPREVLIQGSVIVLPVTFS